MNTPICLPARWGSVRLPGKLARVWRGTPVLTHVTRIALDSGLGPVHVLSDDPRLDLLGAEATVHRVEGPWRNGSERIAAAVRAGLIGAADRILNLQADAVGASPAALAAALDALDADPSATLATVAVRAPRESVVGRTTVVAAGGRALYFSRHALPAAHTGPATVLAHLGIYAYRTDRLLEIAACPPGPLEDAEGLEQLRWLEQGDRIALAVLDGPAALAAAVDSAADLVEPGEHHAPQGVDGGR